MYLTFAIVTVVLLVLTFAPILRVEHWTIRGLDFPRLQFLILTLFLVILEIVVLDLMRVEAWLLLGISLLCMVYHACWIFPYTRFRRLEVNAATEKNEANTFSIITANVLQKNRNAGALLDLVRHYKPHVLVTLESNKWWEERLDVLEQEDGYIHTVKCPLDNLYGMHVYSRLPLSESIVSYLLKEDVPSIHTKIELPGGTLIGAHFLHPEPPSPSESVSSSPRDAELVAVGKSVSGDLGPVVVAGDLNDVAWSRTTRLFRKISGLFDPRIGRGMFNTFHAGHWFLRWPLDHLFHSIHFTVNNIRRLSYIGSDHFPLYTELVYEGRHANEDNTPSPDADDQKMARKKMNREGIDESEVPNH